MSPGSPEGARFPLLVKPTEGHNHLLQPSYTNLLDKRSSEKVYAGSTTAVFVVIHTSDCSNVLTETNIYKDGHHITSIKRSVEHLRRESKHKRRLVVYII